MIPALAALSLPVIAAPPKQPAKPSPLWVTAYYPVWVQQAGTLTPAGIDYSAFSHLIHFALVPAPDGTIDTSKDNITPADSATVIAPAHKAGRKVLLSVGGWLSAAAFRSAYSDAHRGVFIGNLVGMVVSRGYDGLDVDMEPLASSDAPGYTSLSGT